MDASPPNSLLPVIRRAITPLILISGVGAPKLTLTDRKGRIVERARRPEEAPGS